MLINVPCSEPKCPNPAVAEYLEPSAERRTLCTDCAIRFVRVASIRGFLLTIDAFSPRDIEPSTESDGSKIVNTGDVPNDTIPG